MKGKIIRDLAAVEWDFPKRFSGLTRSFHWYPGTFPSELPASLIEICSNPGKIVMDPFGGIGTTFLEAVRLGRNAISVDSNPVAIIVSQASMYMLLLSWRDGKYIDPGNWLNIGEHPTLLRDWADDEFEKKYPPGILGDVIEIRSVEPNWTELGRWLHPSTLSDVQNYFKNQIASETYFHLAMVRFLALSGIIKALCSQSQSWGHIADNVYPKSLVDKSLKQHLLRLSKMYKNILLSIEYPEETQMLVGWRKAILHDWKLKLSDDSLPKADLVVTSPPYASAIDYNLSQKLSFYLLGYTQEEITERAFTELGARRKRFRRNATEEWAEILGATFINIESCIKDDALMCIILPHKEAGRQLGTESIKQSLLRLGRRPIFEIDRSINQAQTRQSWTSIKQETIVVIGGKE